MSLPKQGSFCNLNSGFSRRNRALCICNGGNTPYYSGITTPLHYRISILNPFFFYSFVQIYLKLHVGDNRQQPSPLIRSIEISPARNSRLTQHETNQYIARCVSVLAWCCLAGRSPVRLVTDLFAQHQRFRFVVCCPYMTPPRQVFVLIFWCQLYTHTSRDEDGNRPLLHLYFILNEKVEVMYKDYLKYKSHQSS